MADYAVGAPKLIGRLKDLRDMTSKGNEAIPFRFTTENSRYYNSRARGFSLVKRGDGEMNAEAGRHDQFHVVTVRKTKRILAGGLAVWLGCASQVTTIAQERPQSNWTSADVPCAKYDDLRNPVLGDIGVKIDATEPWADGFRRALTFWNTVLATNLHEETNLSACAIRIISVGSDILNKAMVARSQLTERDNFRGKIAVNPRAAKAMSSGAMYGTAVHELGHMLGLQHNPSSHSVMYFLNVDGTEVLDDKDMWDLSVRHKLRAAVVETGLLPMKVVLTAPPATDAPRGENGGGRKAIGGMGSFFVDPTNR